MKKWVSMELDKEKVQEIAEKYHLPIFTALLLTIRGCTERESIEHFLDNSFQFPDPFSIKDMDKAVERISEALRRFEKICIYGDYDCDGVTSTALLYSYLGSLSDNVMYYIPNRASEGYGMNKKAIDKLKEEGVQLIITVDNGIAAIDEVLYAGQLGMDVVVTDHHTPQEILPRAAAVIDPHRLDDTSDFTDCCGAGLALMLVMALEGDDLTAVDNYADLAALGTVADLVPLRRVNRTLVKAGMMQLENNERPGLIHLMEQAQIDKVTAGTIGFRLAPRINAAGRLGSPYDALTLLLTEDDEQAQNLAEQLSDLNARRQSIETDIFEDICHMLEQNPVLTLDRVIVVSSEQWHAGVIGIVASRITEKYGKPCLIISEDEQICKGSGRSIAGFSLIDAIFACADLLERYGGHPMAAGISLKREKIDAFREAINRYADEQEHMPLPVLKIDSKLNPGTIVVDMVHQQQQFEPFGYGNPKPVFSINNMKLEKIVPLSGGKHIKLVVSRDNARLNLVKFSTSPDMFPYEEGRYLDIALTLDINLYQQQEYISLLIKEVKPANFDTETAMLELQQYEQYQKGHRSAVKGQEAPGREEFAAVYRYIRQYPKALYTIESVLSALNVPSLGAFKLLMIFDILHEMQLIEYRRCADELFVRMRDINGKVNLETSVTYRKLKEVISHVKNDS